jgi:hypothetical protein
MEFIIHLFFWLSAQIMYLIFMTKSYLIKLINRTKSDDT